MCKYCLLKTDPSSGYDDETKPHSHSERHTVKNSTAATRNNHLIRADSKFEEDDDDESKGEDNRSKERRETSDRRRRRMNDQFRRSRSPKRSTGEKRRGSSNERKSQTDRSKSPSRSRSSSPSYHTQKRRRKESAHEKHRPTREESPPNRLRRQSSLSPPPRLKAIRPGSPKPHTHTQTHPHVSSTITSSSSLPFPSSSSSSFVNVHTEVIPARDPKFTYLPIEWWDRSEECREAKVAHVARIDELCSRERLVLNTTLWKEDPALEENMFPYETPPGIVHYTLWSRDELTKAQVISFVDGWLSKNFPQVRRWQYDDNLGERSIELFHVHVYVEMIPYSFTPREGKEYLPPHMFE